MVRLLVSLLLLIPLAISAQESTFFDRADTFFQRYVSDGKVDYAAIQTAPAALQDLRQQIERFPLESAPVSLRKAFLLNAYNLLLIASVIEHYPVDKPTDIDGIFRQQQHRVAGRYLTLDELENTELRPVYQDPRIHFALVCGALSCPKLPSTAFRPAQLDAQLDARTTGALNDPSFIHVDHRLRVVAISEIFNWFKADFGSDDQGIRSFINTYRKTPIPKSYRLTTYPYDWRLNDR